MGCQQTAKAAGIGQDSPARQWQIAATYAQSLSRLSFDDGMEPELLQRMVALSAARFLDHGLTLRLALGAVLDGELEGEGEVHQVDPGFLGAFAVEWRWLDEQGWIPYLKTSLGLTVSAFKTRDREPAAGPAEGTSPTFRALQAEGDPVRWTAIDLRLALTAGYTFWQWLGLHVALRGFFGPILWEHQGQDTIGTDRDHFQVAAGTTILLPAGLNLFLDGSFLGEKSLSAGLGLIF